jgi:peptide/nickel transport system permease protein
LVTTSAPAATLLTAPAPRRRSRWLVRLGKSPVGLLGALLVALVILVAVTAPWLAPHDPAKQNYQARLLPPAWYEDGDPTYLLGTDSLGRDQLSRILYGAQVSVFVGVMGVAISLLIGVSLGLISGYVGGMVDALTSRMLDTFMSIPFILLALAVVGVLGPRQGNGLVTLIVVLGVTGWVTFTRVVRGEVLAVKEREYVQSAVSIGQRRTKIMLGHVLPNVTASIIVLATLQIGTVIIAEASLSFLGLGVQPPTITWGIMLSEGRDYLATSWWLSTFPGIAITLTVLGVILLGDWLRDVLDPRQKT